MPKPKFEYVSSRDEAVAKLIEAGTKILHRHTPEQIADWASTTADSLIKAGRILIDDSEVRDR